MECTEIGMFGYVECFLGRNIGNCRFNYGNVRVTVELEIALEERDVLRQWLDGDQLASPRQ